MPHRSALWCFVMCLFAYAMSSSGRLGTWDADMYYAVTERLVTEGRLDLPEELVIGHPEWRGRGGRFYAPFDIGQSLVNVPFYLIGEGAAGALAALMPGRRAAIEYLIPRGAVALSNALWMALAIGAAGGIARALRWGRRAQAGAMLAAGFATMAWPYATVGFNQALAALGQTMAFWGAVRWARGGRRPADAWLAGAGAAVGLAARLNTALALPWLLLILIEKHNRESDIRPARLPGSSLVGFLTPVAGALALAAFYNWIRFETVWRGGYQGDANTNFALSNLPLHLYLLIVSPAKGLLWFMPSVVLAAFGAWRARGEAWAQATAGIALTYLIFFSLMNYGHGGVHSWGPRFFAPLMPLAGLLIIEGWRALPPGRRGPRVMAGALIALSAVIQLLAVSSDQSERVAAMEGEYNLMQSAVEVALFTTTPSNKSISSLFPAAAPRDYFAASWTRPALSPIVDRAEVFAHKLARWQGMGLAAEPSAFFRAQQPRVIFLPPEQTASWDVIPARQKTLVLRYRYCFDFWWCYATAMGLWPRWIGAAAALGALAAAGVISWRLRAALRASELETAHSCNTASTAKDSMP